MSDSLKKVKPTLETLLKENQVISGRDLMEQKKVKDRELALFQQAIEFEKRNRKTKRY